MERRTEQSPPRQPDRGQHKFRDRLVAIIELPLTLQRLVAALERQNIELAHYRRLPETLADLTEVGQDLNEGFYSIFGGRVRYNRIREEDGAKNDLGESDSVSFDLNSLLKPITLLLRRSLFR